MPLPMSSAGPRDATAFEVREALREEGCAVCRLTLRSVAKLLQSIAYEQVNDIAVRHELRRTRGFCNHHAFQWVHEVRSVLGTALIYRDVLRAALRDLEAPPSREGLLRGILSPPRHGRRNQCPACRAQLQAEERYLEALLAVVSAEPGLLDASEGACRRHTLAALRIGGSGAELVAGRTRRAVEAVLRDLDEVIRKEDYRFRDEPRTEGERSAPSRAVTWVVGTDGLVES